MTEKMIRDAYVRIRTIDQTIPDDVLDFMKDASIEKLKQVNNNIVLADVSGQVCGHRSIMHINSEIGWLCFDCRKFSLDKQTFR